MQSDTFNSRYKCGLYRWLPVAVFCLLLASPLSGAPVFPTSSALEPAVEFWTQVFAIWKVDEVAFHDRIHMDVVYGVVNIQQELGKETYSSRDKSRVIKKYIAHYRDILDQIHQFQATPEKLGPEERRVMALLDGVDEANKYRAAKSRLRAQTGLRENFLAGLQRQGTYIDEMRAIFREEGIPEDITLLPHVESSFNYNAVSRYRAVGIWQFLYRTGRQYLRIDKYVDERRNPIQSTRAAARLFKASYRKVGSWPLAVMAHNHGVNGISRAIRQVNTRDVTTIINTYKSRSFGFASRNFYPEFLAVIDIVGEYQMYFGDVRFHPAVHAVTYRLPTTTSARALKQEFGISDDVFKDLNPGLASAIHQGRMRIPKGVRINFPVRAAVDYAAALGTRQPTTDSTPQPQTAGRRAATISPRPVAPPQPLPPWRIPQTDAVTDQYVTVVLPGETVWHFVSWSGIPASTIRTVNGFTSSRGLRLNQHVRLPLSAGGIVKFEQQRQQYHQELAQGFFIRHKITGTVDHIVRWGENLWDLSTHVYEVPLWLVVRYNPEKNLSKLQVGDVLVIPIVQRV